MSQDRRLLAVSYVIVAVLALVGMPEVGSGQQPETHEQRAERFRQRSIDAEKERLGSYEIIAPLGAGWIEELKASIPKGTLDGLVANASTLSPAAVLAMIGG